MGRGTWLSVLSACAFAAAFPLVAEAAEDALQPQLTWEFDGGLYGWALWVQGDATTRGLTFDVYADPIDLIDALDGPIIMGNFEASRGPFSLYADAVYAKFGFDGDFLGETQPIPLIKLKRSGRVDADYEFGVYQADGFFEIANFTSAKGNDTTFEIGAGARWTRQELDVRAAINDSVTLDLGSRLQDLRQRIRRIQNQQDRLAALARLNALRDALLNKRITFDDSRGLTKRAARLKNRLNKVGKRSQVVGALEKLEQFRIKLLQSIIGLDGATVSRDFVTANSGVLEWVDPVIATRMTHELGNGQSFTAMGDVGGFQSDDLSWQVVLTFDCEGTLFGFETTTSLGYKALGLHYEESTPKGTRGQDVILHGPLAELSFGW
jgi:hypothetical protein